MKSDSSHWFSIILIYTAGPLYLRVLIHGFKQLQIKDIPKNSRKFPKTKLEFTPRWQVFLQHLHSKGLPGGASSKEPTCQCNRCKRLRFSPWVGKIPCRRKWQPTPVLLPGGFHGQLLAGYIQSMGLHRVGHD